MSDLLKKIDAATTQLAELQAERTDAEKSANAHEEQARADRRRMTALKNKIGEISVALSHDRAMLAHAQAKAEADARAARLAERETAAKEQQARIAAKEAELDALLAQAKVPPAE